MGEVDWIPGLVVTALGVVGGLILALRGGKASAPVPPVSTERADLLARKAELYEQLRDLDDMADRRGPDVDAERAALEREAASVLRKLAGSEAAQAAPPPPAAAPQAAAPAPAPSGFLTAELRGGLVGAAVVALGAAVLWGLQNNAGVRPEGGIATGGDFLPWGATEGAAPREGETPAPGAPGGAVPDVPPSLQPKPSAAVDAARARVASNPRSVEASVQLGWALIDAEGWIDAYRRAEEILKLDPNSPDGRVISAAVRIVMGQESVARTLIDEALSIDPRHLQALSYDGMLKLRAGDREGAALAWEAAKAAGGEPSAYDDLIAMARSDAPLPTRTPSAHPGEMGSPAPAAPADDAARISGTIALAEGATPPPGGAIFVIARRPGVAAGPPAATAKFPPKLPLQFSLGQENVMMGGPFPDAVELTVRWDADGDAMTKGDADLWGAADATVAKGAAGVEIVLR